MCLLRYSNVYISEIYCPMAITYCLYMGIILAIGSCQHLHMVHMMKTAPPPWTIPICGPPLKTHLIFCCLTDDPLNNSIIVIQRSPLSLTSPMVHSRVKYSQDTTVNNNKSPRQRKAAIVARWQWTFQILGIKKRIDANHWNSEKQYRTFLCGLQIWYKVRF